MPLTLSAQHSKHGSGPSFTAPLRATRDRAAPKNEERIWQMAIKKHLSRFSLPYQVQA